MPTGLFDSHFIDGADIDLGQLLGKQAAYLKFWATLCVPCRHWMHFNDLVEEIQKCRKQVGINMPIVMYDGTLADALHLRVTPQHIAFSRRRSLRNASAAVTIIDARPPTMKPFSNRQNELYQQNQCVTINFTSDLYILLRLLMKRFGAT